jgi:mevalonate kinase
VGFVGSGWAKLLLFGEHAAVYGHPAVGLSLGEALRVHLHPNPESENRWSLEGVQEEDREPIFRVLDLLGELSGQGPGNRQVGGTMQLESQIPRGLGFGSSASLCVALACAVAADAGEKDPRRIWEWAHRAEALFHGTPSGIDTGLALLGGLYSFRPAPPRLPEAERLAGVPLHLVVGAVPRSDSAGALIGALREKIMGKDQGAEAILGRLGGLAAKAVEILRAGGTEAEGRIAAGQLGALATEAHKTLRALDLSTPELDRLLEEGRAKGALGGKLSGAGGGGAFFLICADPLTAGGVAAALQQLSRSWKLPTADTIYPLSWIPNRDG